MTHPTPTPAEAEADAEHARAGLISTLSQLRDNLQPAHVIEEVMGNAKVSASAISNQIWDTARKNPLPALMIGAGLAMIFGLSSRAVSSGAVHRVLADVDTGFASDTRSSASVERVAPVISTSTSRLESAYESVKSQASDILDGANERLTEAAAKAASLGRKSSSNVMSGNPMSSNSRNDLMNTASKMLEDQPLILAAIGIAVGAAIGAAIPRTDTENSLMGESSHSVRDAAQGLVEGQYAQLKSAASHAVDDIKQSVADHGMTTDNLSGLAHDVAEKAKAATYEAGRTLDPTKA